MSSTLNKNDSQAILKENSHLLSGLLFALTENTSNVIEMQSCLSMHKDKK